MPKSHLSFSYVAAAALLAGSLVVATPLYAQSMGLSAPVNQPAASQDDKAEAMNTHGMQKVEQRIKTLHSKLKITPDEENDWKVVRRR